MRGLIDSFVPGVKVGHDCVCAVFVDLAVVPRLLFDQRPH